MEREVLREGLGQLGKERDLGQSAAVGTEGSRRGMTSPRVRLPTS